jgi:hypothetical protein
MGVFKSVYFGYPDWVDSQTVFGTAYDFAFQLTGEGEPPLENLDCDGELSWEEIVPGDNVTGSFDVSNIGEAGSLLDWAIVEHPEWGVWTFDPESGAGLGSGETTTVEVEVVAPGEENEEYTGEVKIVNNNDPDDFCIIDVTLKTPCDAPINSILEFLAQRFPFFGFLMDLLF